jgi:hypothetical protein
MKPKAFLLLSGLLFAASVLLFLLRPSPRWGVTADPPALLKEIQRLNELVTVKYSLQKVIGIEEQKQPFGSEKLLLIVQARVLAGVDLAALTPSDISVRPGLITVRTPAPKILHVVIDEKETKVWDRQITWWTPWVPFNKDLESRARVAAIDSIRTAAIDMGILAEAERNAKASIRSLLEAVGIPKVSFSPAS